MYRFLLRPKWIALTLVVILLVVLMLNLSAWQFRRLDEKKSFNRTVTSRIEMPVAQFADVLGPDTRSSGVEWRRVHMSGTYISDKAVRVVNRSQDGTAGLDTVVPFRLADGRIVLVNRGFVPLSIDVPTAPTREISIVGYLRATQSRGSFGAVDQSGSEVRDFQRVDIPKIATAVEMSLLPMYVQRISETPPSPSQWPAAVTFPPLDEGPHLSYAFQWIFFSLCAIAGWLVVTRRETRRSATRSSS